MVFGSFECFFIKKGVIALNIFSLAEINMYIAEVQDEQPVEALLQQLGLKPVLAAGFAANMCFLRKKKKVLIILIYINLICYLRKRRSGINKEIDMAGAFI